jgi:hypothetical protein
MQMRSISVKLAKILKEMFFNIILDIYLPSVHIPCCGARMSDGGHRAQFFK